MDSTAGPSPTDHLEPTAVAQSGAGLTPFDLQQVTLTRREHIELRHQLSSYRTLHGKAVSRMQRMQRVQEIAGTHDAEVLESEVKAYRRVVRR
jgi:hypothetical protein